MILKDKKIVIMGIRNKWSIAWGAAQSAYEQGAQVIFTCGSMEKIEKIKELTNEIPNSDGESPHQNSAIANGFN